MSARDELAALIRENRAAWVTNSEHRQMEEAQADAILAAGFRRVNNLDASAVERVANVLIEDGAFGVPWGDASEEDRAEAMDKAHVLLEAAGHAQPRAITTVEELDALPDGSVVMNCYGDASTVHWELRERKATAYHHLVQHGPATVLYSPADQ